MTISAPSAATELSATDQLSESRNRLVLLVYTAAIFVSALLLFAVQPMFARMVLPNSAALRPCGRSRWCFFQCCCSAATPTRIFWSDHLRSLQLRRIRCAPGPAPLALPFSIATALE